MGLSHFAFFLPVLTLANLYRGQREHLPDCTSDAKNVRPRPVRDIDESLA